MKKETTRVTTIEITEVFPGEDNSLHGREETRKMWLGLIGHRDDVHVTVQDFVMEVEE